VSDRPLRPIADELADLKSWFPDNRPESESDPFEIGSVLAADRSTLWMSLHHDHLALLQPIAEPVATPAITATPPRFVGQHSRALVNQARFLPILGPPPAARHNQAGGGYRRDAIDRG